MGCKLIITVILLSITIIFFVVSVTPGTFKECYTASDCNGFACNQYQCMCYGGWQCVPGRIPPLNPFWLVTWIFLIALLIFLCCIVEIENQPSCFDRLRSHPRL